MDNSIYVELVIAFYNLTNQSQKVIEFQTWVLLQIVSQVAAYLKSVLPLQYFITK